MDLAEDNGSVVSKIINLNNIEKFEEVPNEDTDNDIDESPSGVFEVFKDDIIAKDKPFVIEEDRVGEYISYDLISLIYFGDGVLTDDWEVPVENPDETVGKEYIEYFETGEDVVYVRNDKLKCEFEITRDLRTYEEVKEEASER